MPNPIRVPDDTRSLHAIGDFIMSYQPYQNAFANALVNRICMTLITSKMWNQPLARFMRGKLDFGETVQEIFVNISKSHSYDPATASSKVYERELPDVRAAYHSMNYQKFYKQTVSEAQLHQAFLAWSELTSLVAKITEAMYTSMNKDGYLVTKYMVGREALNGGFYVVTTPDIDGTQDDRDNAIVAYREHTNLMTFLKSDFNRAHVETHTPVESQVMLIPSHAEAVIGVKSLAYAFNMDEMQYLGQRVLIDTFVFSASDQARLNELFENDSAYTPFTSDELASLEKINAIKVDESWFMIFNEKEEMTQLYNGEGLYWNYWLHVWMTYSVSPYANAIAFSSETSAIKKVAVTPSTANVTQGADIAMTAAVTGTGLIDKTVTWSISGQTASGTTINANSGVLHVAKDETAATAITVTATAVDGTSGTGTITVVAA